MAFGAGWGGVVYETLNLDTEEEILHPSPRLGPVHERPVCYLLELESDFRTWSKLPIELLPTT
jgi:hypothetical protein